MEQALTAFSEGGFVCETCGDEGFTNAFVFCVNCLNAVIHRYCLNILPRTCDEPVLWWCEDCKPKDSLKQALMKPKHTQPLVDPVWRGSFTVHGSSYGLFEGFVAHLSNKACDKAFKEANMLPSLLHLELLPKPVLLPKSFHEYELSNDDIGLYIFPEDPINEKAFDQLVSDMIDERLTMRALTKNAELLIFTSLVLEPLFWRFRGKFYLWGIFRSKRNKIGAYGVDMDSECGD